MKRGLEFIVIFVSLLIAVSVSWGRLDCAVVVPPRLPALGGWLLEVRGS